MGGDCFRTEKTCYKVISKDVQYVDGRNNEIGDVYFYENKCVLYGIGHHKFVCVKNKDWDHCKLYE